SAIGVFLGSGLRTQVDALAFGQSHVGFATIAAASRLEPEALVLALEIDHGNGVDLHAEDLLHGRFDFGLGRTLDHLEHILVVQLLRTGRLFGDDRRPQDVVQAVIAAHASHSSIFLTESTVMNTRWVCTRLTGSSAPASVT